MFSRVSFGLLFLLVFTFSASAQSGEEPEDPRKLSFLECDWGLLTVEEPTEPPAIYLDIGSPADYSAVGSTFTVSGTGAGLFEGNVIVTVTPSGSDSKLFEGTTILQSQEPGGAGEWSIEVNLGNVAESTVVFVDAYSTSPDDGSTTAFDDLRLNANSKVGLPYVEIARPYFGEGVPNFQMPIDGMAGGAFENNIVVQVQNFATGDVLVETPVTVQTDDAGGSGRFSTMVDFDAEPGTPIEIHAFQPPVADGEEVTVSDVAFAIVDPLGRTYERILNVRRDDPILGAEDVCAIARAEFDNTNIAPLTVSDVAVFELIAPTPLVNLSVHAMGSSHCSAPLRSRITNMDNAFDIEVYLDTTYPAACTADLAPITQRLALGTLPSPDYTITVNGTPVEYK